MSRVARAASARTDRIGRLGFPLGHSRGSASYTLRISRAQAALARLATSLKTSLTPVEMIAAAEAAFAARAPRLEYQPQYLTSCWNYPHSGTAAKAWRVTPNRQYRRSNSGCRSTCAIRRRPDKLLALGRFRCRTYAPGSSERMSPSI